MNADFHDMLSALCAEGVEFLLVGAHALAVHGHPRATGDLDLWIRPSPENAARTWRALARFGAPLENTSPDDLQRPDVVIQIGVPPLRIDLMTVIDGVAFDEAWPGRVTVEREGLALPVIGRAELLRNKEASGRPQDLADADFLRRQPPA